MAKKRKLTRRQFLHVSAVAAAGTLAAACAGPMPVPTEQAPEAPAEEEAPEEPAAEPASEGKYKEAPTLAELVVAGELSPVDERLPEEPFVVGPGVLVYEDDLDWEVGEYSREGEILRSVTNNPEWSYPCQHALEWFLNTPKHHTGPITGNLCSHWKVNDDCTEYEFTLRKGLKWSDGVPVTTEDILFAYEDIQMNPDVTPVLGSTLRAGADPAGEPMKLVAVDDYTFTVSFAAPNGRFLKMMGMGNLWNPYCFLLKPKHYLKQFHKTYTPMEELKPILDQEGLSEEEWPQLCLNMGAGWWGGGCEHAAEAMPVLRPWIVKESPEDLIIMERNPYYHKVDTEGQQLPYVDRIEGVVVTNPENIPMKIVNCEGNYMRERLHHEDISLYKEHEDECGYRVTLDMVYHNAPVALFINYNNPNEAWRTVVTNKTFRHAINAAIDYREIIEVLFLGMGDVNPWIPDVNDKDEANRLLDEVGLAERDDEGWRIGPDGERFEFRMDVRLDPLFGQPAEVIKAHLEDVGIYTPLKQMEGSLWTELRDANELFASIDWLDDCNWPYIMWDYMPNSRIQWAQLWHRWMQTDGEEGEEPQDWMKELYALDAEMRSINPNTTQAEDAEKRFAEWYKEYIPIFPLARDVIDPCIVPQNLGNVAHSGRSSAVWFAQEQVFFKHR
jgi:peptide/nickel transport system substrate-binding protein